MPHGYSRHPSSANRSLGAFTHASDGSAQNVSSHTGAHADTPHGCSGHPSGRKASLGTNLQPGVGSGHTTDGQCSGVGAGVGLAVVANCGVGAGVGCPHAIMPHGFTGQPSGPLALGVSTQPSFAGGQYTLRQCAGGDGTGVGTGSESQSMMPQGCTGQPCSSTRSLSLTRQPGLGSEHITESQCSGVGVGA
jgi:hypothetical protein